MGNKIYLQYKFFNLIKFIDGQCTGLNTRNYQGVTCGKMFGNFEMNPKPALTRLFCFETVDFFNAITGEPFIFSMGYPLTVFPFKVILIDMTLHS